MEEENCPECGQRRKERAFLHDQRQKGPQKNDFIRNANAMKGWPCAHGLKEMEKELGHNLREKELE